MIKITHIMWCKQAIGIAERKLKKGVNQFQVTVKDKNGEPLYPGIYSIDREEAIQKYGMRLINQRNLYGIWVPLKDLIEMEKINECG
jgi:hypothetical protein